MATETTNLKLNKPDKTDFYNIDLVNINMDKIDEAIGEKANKGDIPSIPDSLPANGGNADTLDGKHASDFRNTSFRTLANGTSLFDYVLNTMTDRTSDTIRIYDGVDVPTKYGYVVGANDFLFHIDKIDNGYSMIKAKDNRGNREFMIRSGNGVWQDWKEVCDGGNADTVDGYHAWQQQCLSDTGIAYSYWSFLQWNGAIGHFVLKVDGADGSHHNVHVNNADMVDGYHVEVRPENYYGLRAIAMDKFDLQAGVTPMPVGQIYIMYE